MANSNAIPMVPEAARQESWKRPVQLAFVGALSLFFLYIVFTMYAQAEVLYGTMLLVFTGLFAFIFSSERAYVWRYVFPGLIGVFTFVIFPIMYTLGITFTNQSNLNLLSFQSAKNYFLQQTYISPGSVPYDLTLYQEGDEYLLMLSDPSGQLYITQSPLPLTHTEPMVVGTKEILVAPEKITAPRNAAINFRNELTNLQLQLPNGTTLAKSKLREYAEKYPLWESADKNMLINLDDGTVITANFETGFFETEEGKTFSPGFQINVGFKNYKRILTEPGVLAPFTQIFIWTIFFAIFTVIVTFFVGMILASFVQWEPIKFRGVYQVLLILPYAVPAFILFMIFRALFNQNFGVINYVLEALFAISPGWQTDPHMTRSMLLIVNVFMGYPYMFILCLGMLQSIPKDLYEASGLEGAGPITNFFKITLPLVIKPMLPLMIAGFAFNFNNFTIIQLMTRGGPIIVGSDPQAGETDLLVNYAFRLAFTGQVQDFALAATVSTFIFILVGILMIAYLKAAKIEVGLKR